MAEAAKAQAILPQGDKQASFRTAFAGLEKARALHAAGQSDAARDEAIVAETLLRETADRGHTGLAEARRLAATG